MDGKLNDLLFGVIEDRTETEMKLMKINKYW
jgi:hypothetical protein